MFLTARSLTSKSCIFISTPLAVHSLIHSVFWAGPHSLSRLYFVFKPNSPTFVRQSDLLHANMRFAITAAMIAFGALTAVAKPTRRASPTIYTCGDSTMAKDGAANGETDGWGQYLGDYTTASVVNKAIAGRSARSYWEEGRFAAVADLVVEGDIVVIEFGHNDGGSPESEDNSRSDCPGDGTETCTSDADGSTVYTFVYYMIKAAELMIEKGASVVLSTQSPNNPCKFRAVNLTRPDASFG